MGRILSSFQRIASQCLQISKQVAENDKPPFMFPIYEILRHYCSTDQEGVLSVNSVVDYNTQKAKYNLIRIKQNIMTVRANRKL